MTAPTMPIGMSRSTSGSASPPGARREAAIAERMPLEDRADDPEQGPDRGDADHAGAEEAHVGAEDGGRDLLGRRRRGRWSGSAAGSTSR